MTAARPSWCNRKSPSLLILRCSSLFLRLKKKQTSKQKRFLCHIPQLLFSSFSDHFPCLLHGEMGASGKSHIGVHSRDNKMEIVTQEDFCARTQENGL